MLTREAFDGEILRFEKEIENKLTDESIETLWRFFSMHSVKFLKVTLMKCAHHLEHFELKNTNGQTLHSKPKDIQALFNIMDTMMNTMEEQNDRWAKICRDTNRLWFCIYLFLFLSLLIDI